MKYKKILSKLSKNSSKKSFDEIKVKYGNEIYCHAINWGYNNDILNKDVCITALAIMYPALNAVITGSIDRSSYIDGKIELFTLNGRNLFIPWYKKFLKLTYESCGKYWIPIMLGSAIYNFLREYLPTIISWFL